MMSPTMRPNVAFAFALHRVAQNVCYEIPKPCCRMMRCHGQITVVGRKGRHELGDVHHEEIARLLAQRRARRSDIAPDLSAIP